VPRTAFYGNNIAGFQFDIVLVFEKLLAAAFESYLNNVEWLVSLWHDHVGKPIVNIQLVASAGATRAVVVATGRRLTIIGCGTGAAAHKFRYNSIKMSWDSGSCSF
jgi:hypothetical protein